MKATKIVVVLLLVVVLLASCCTNDECTWSATCENLFNDEWRTESGDGCHCHCTFGYKITNCSVWCP